MDGEMLHADAIDKLLAGVDALAGAHDDAAKRAEIAADEHEQNRQEWGQDWGTMFSDHPTLERGEE